MRQGDKETRRQGDEESPRASVSPCLPVSLSVSRRPAYMLFEIAAVMAFAGIILMLAAAILVGVVKISRAATDDVQMLVVQKSLADQFRADVARAVAAPDQWENYQAGSTCLILRGTEGRSVIYRWEAGRLQRTELTSGKKIERPLPVGARIRPEFRRSGPDQRLLTLCLLETRRPVTTCRVEISAALGGDQQ